MTGALGWLAAATYDGASVSEAQTAIVSNVADAEAAPTTSTAAAATTVPAATAAPTVSTATGSAHASSGGS